VSYVNHHFIRRLPDETECIALKQLDVEVCLSAECDEQWGFVGAKSNQRVGYGRRGAVCARENNA